jgi:Rrf2 family protein
MKNGCPSNLFRVSEAANLALHASAVLAGTGNRLVRTLEIAAGLKASTAHLAKVLGALERAGLVTGTRGPSGGYRLNRPAERISLKEVYEAIEGPLAVGKCLFGVPVCNGDRCILGGFFEKVNRQVADKLSKTRLSETVVRIGVKRGKAKRDNKES